MIKPKVLYYALQPSDSTSFWRISAVLPYISHADFEMVDGSGIISWNWSVLIGVSILIIQRPFTKEHCNLITMAKDMGVKIILDYDDGLLSVDQNNPTYGLYLSQRQSLLDCIKMADELWVSTQAIKDEYKHFNTHVVPNAHNDYLFPVKNKRPFTANKKVMWRGGASHQADVLEHAEKLVKVINDNMDWTFSFCGDRFTYMETRCDDNYHIVGGMSIMQFFKYLYQENPSIMIFPLCDTQFNRGKSNISWLEGAWSGAAFYGNKDLPEFQKPGVLSFDFLTENISNSPELHSKSNKLSWEYICDNLLLSKVNQLRSDRILANL